MRAVIHLTICHHTGYNIKKMQEDGSCLFRAVADQIYGDEEMHTSVRRHCMDYIVSKRFKILYGQLIV